MKKTVSLIIILILLLSLSPASFAENSAPFVLPVLPDGHPEDHTPSVAEFQFALSETEVFSSDLPYYANRLTISVTESGDYFSGVTWTAGATGGSGSYSYEFILV